MSKKSEYQRLSIVTLVEPGKLMRPMAERETRVRGAIQISPTSPPFS
jgi:hypothetical protein